MAPRWLKKKLMLIDWLLIIYALVGQAYGGGQSSSDNNVMHWLIIVMALPFGSSSGQQVAALGPKDDPKCGGVNFLLLACWGRGQAQNVSTSSFCAPVFFRLSHPDFAR